MSQAPTPSRWRPFPWQEIGVVAAIAGVVASVALGVYDVVTRPDDEVPADERLELVDLEFSRAAIAVLEYVAPGATPTVAPDPAYDGNGPTVAGSALVVTLRNPSDDPAVLTAIRLVVHETTQGGRCGGTGGGVAASLNYEFRFPENVVESPWVGTNSQNFSVPAHGVDALSITMGPEVDNGVTLWRFSIYGVSTKGREAHWGDGYSISLDGSETDHINAIVGEDPREPEFVRACAADNLQRLNAFLSAADFTIRNPAIESHLSALRQLAS